MSPKADGLRQTTRDEDAAELQRAKFLVESSISVFVARHVSSDDRLGWPYRLKEGETLESAGGPFSYSTNGMILAALLAAQGRRTPRSELLPGHIGALQRARFSLPTEVKDRQRETVQTLVDCAKEDAPIKSSTFGTDDPFSLLWLAECVTALVDSKANSTDIPEGLASVETWVRSAAERLHARCVPDQPLLTSDHEETNHPLPPLRLLQLRRFYNLSSADTPSDYFRRVLSSNLANHAIPDTIFDAAELVFALEGLILADLAPSEREIEQIFKLLVETQSRSPYWRPLRPFIATRQGFALLPLSLEIANSLLRICVRLRRLYPERSFFSDYLPLFTRYFQWLRSRRVQITVEDRTLFGWHSEHVLFSKTIDLWETSQVVAFLVLYMESLADHIAESSLSDTRLVARTVDSDFGTWQNASTKLEPFPDGPEELRVYEGITRRFVAGGARVGEGGSILLYGPPGTGKTTFAKELAAGLQRRLITITPSDFLAEGPSQVEARAKHIFGALEHQAGIVVLFDEIDRLILDRDSRLYREQSDAFQFMTPSMLVKIRDLRERGLVFFIIATNYWERIDPAARRAGRIDVSIPLMPPSLSRRIVILRHQLTDRFPSVGADVPVESIARSVPLMTYGELKSAVQSLPRDLADPDAVKQQLEAALESIPPLVRLDGYLNYRFKETWSHEGSPFPAALEPWDELLRLLWILNEVQSIKPANKEALQSVLRSGEREIAALPKSLRDIADAIVTGT